MIVFSPFALFSRLPADHYKCWLNFVQACKLLSQPIIKIADLGRAHSLLLQFCREVERTYGTMRITLNMHMHSHLADCILDYMVLYIVFRSSVLSVTMVFSGRTQPTTNLSSTH